MKTEWNWMKTINKRTRKVKNENLSKFSFFPGIIYRLHDVLRDFQTMSGRTGIEPRVLTLFGWK